jgi:hypothetical protein
MPHRDQSKCAASMLGYFLPICLIVSLPLGSLWLKTFEQIKEDHTGSIARAEIDIVNPA